MGVRAERAERMQLVKTQVEAILPELGKHKIEELRGVIDRHFERRFAPKRRVAKYGALNKGFTDQSLHAFMFAIENEKYKLLFGYMAYLGLRIGEVCRINTKDIDFQTREIKILSEKTHRLDLLIVPLPLFESTIDFIETHKPEISKAQGYLFFKDREISKRPEPYVESNYVRKRFRDYIVKANLDQVYDTSTETMQGRPVRKLHILTTHSLRHYAITKFAKQTNGNLILTSKFARHIEPTTTTTYIHTEKEELYAQIENTFNVR